MNWNYLVDDDEEDEDGTDKWMSEIPTSEEEQESEEGKKSQSQSDTSSIDSESSEVPSKERGYGSKVVVNHDQLFRTSSRLQQSEIRRDRRENRYMENVGGNRPGEI